jgi:hypothetical protein
MVSRVPKYEANVVTVNLIDGSKSWDMNGFQIILSKQHGRFICNSKFCNVALDSSQLDNHIKRHHSSNYDHEKVIAMMEELAGSEAINLVNLKNPIIPIPGIPVYDGYKCWLCPQPKYFTNEKGLRFHLTHKHSEKGLDVTGAKFKVQKLNHREKGSVVFPVCNPENVIIKQYDSTYENVFGDIDLSYNCGKLPKCVKALGWYQYFENKDWDHEWSTLNKTDFDEPDYTLEIKHWFRNSYSRLVEEGPKTYDLLLHIGYEK